MTKKAAAPPVKLDRASLERIANVFKLFSEPTRLEIFQALKQGPLSVNELVAELGTSQANVSKQLRILYDSGMLERRRKGTQAFYSIRDSVIFPLCQLVCEKLNRDASQASSLEFSI